MRTMLAAALLLAGGCDRPKAPAPTADVRAAACVTLPTTPEDATWSKAPVHQAELRPQDLVEPRKMVPGIARLQVQALSDGRSIAFRLSWKDPTDDRVRQPASFGDACAVQVPATASTDLPAPQMGERGKPVKISFWSAAAQAALERNSDDIKTRHPNAHIDHYPFTAAPLDQDPAAKEAMARAYSPARALAEPPRKAVEDLVAQGPGTLARDPSGASGGSGRRTPEGWEVLLSRPLPADLKPGARTYVSFAVWNGSEQDAGSRKMWTPWTALVTQGGAK